MIKFFRKIRYNLMETGKTSSPAEASAKAGKYFKYAIGEIILVVIGILIALSINNWNEKQIEKKQIRNIYARIVKDFNNSVVEIDSGIEDMNSNIPIMFQLMREEMDRDSLLTNMDYFLKYFNSTSGFPDIQIHDKGVRMLETKIGLNYEFSTEYSEALILLYSEFLYEIEIDRYDLINVYIVLRDYQTHKGVRPIRLVTNGIPRSVDMMLEDDIYKNHLLHYVSSYRGYMSRLESFKAQGAVLIDQIITEYNLE
ncbi:hypothetical protein OE09_1045 [Flavobacteriaceae bacterium MAR_2010_72]|nr:hypothetical protein OE09_1045 [Flavobacteriaceae bacterium MAR_2010_72]